MRPVFSETDLNERPFLVFWEVTRACALACRHCRAVAQPRPHPDELTHEEALRLIDQLAELRPPMLVLTGGDPVMRPDILELVRAASGKEPGCYRPAAAHGFPCIERSWSPEHVIEPGRRA